MNADNQLVQLCEALERMGVTIRQEHLDGLGGGMCRVRGRYTLFIDLDADIESQLNGCVGSLQELPGIESQYLPPAIRERLDRARSR